jgi:hypothetical protein
MVHNEYTFSGTEVSTILRKAGTCRCSRDEDLNSSVGQEETYSKVKTTRSPFGSGFFVTLTLQSIMDMMPSPNYREPG